MAFGGIYYTFRRRGVIGATPLKAGSEALSSWNLPRSFMYWIMPSRIVRHDSAGTLKGSTERDVIRRAHPRSNGTKPSTAIVSLLILRSGERRRIGRYEWCGPSPTLHPLGCGRCHCDLSPVVYVEMSGSCTIVPATNAAVRPSDSILVNPRTITPQGNRHYRTVLE